MEQNDTNGLNLRTFVMGEVTLDPRYVINDAGDMQIIEFAVMPRRDNE